MFFGHLVVLDGTAEVAKNAKEEMWREEMISKPSCFVCYSSVANVVTGPLCLRHQSNKLPWAPLE